MIGCPERDTLSLDAEITGMSEAMNREREG